MSIAHQIEEGNLITPSQRADLTEQPYRPHPSFPGVYLKDLVTGAMTGGLVSSHLVRVDPHCVLDTHNHPHQVELHEVIAGSGQAMVGDERVVYSPGTIGVLPMGVPHRIAAGEQGIYILAKFTPALI